MEINITNIVRTASGLVELMSELEIDGHWQADLYDITHEIVTKANKQIPVTSDSVSDLSDLVGAWQVSIQKLFYDIRSKGGEIDPVTLNLITTSPLLNGRHTRIH